MAAIDNLIAQIKEPALRERIQAEIQRMNKQKKFGLVFEEHLPECTPLYEVPIRVGSLVAQNTAKEKGIRDIYYVLSIKDNQVTCQKRGSQDEPKVIPMSELVAIAEFGDPIYPYLQPIDKIENAPDSNLWHTLIEADNYHALQLLDYLYHGKVDCIYIDPPYNTGAKDWKYNNDYVDGTDAYRHSKWLSFMEKRLKLAKKLLNPKDSVLIVTIDEKEYLHLGCLLEELFPEANIQMVSITINPSGAKRDKAFSRSDEYIFFVLLGESHVIHPEGKGDEKEVRWWYLRRTDFSSRRGTVKGGTAQFYPIYVDNQTKKIVHIGKPLAPNESRMSVPQINGATPVFPVRDDGVEMNWGLTGASLDKLIKDGVVRVTLGTENQPYVFRYLSANYKTKIKTGRWSIRGIREDGSKIVVETGGKVTRATTVWQNKSYDAGQYGTTLINHILGSGKFSFPKSLFAVHDTLKYFVKDKKDSLILDFFAGSGTTLHAVNLLNAEDGGHRRCIMVTNNEVSDAEAKSLKKQGYKPGDEEWEKLGIAHYVTWPRTACSIKGVNIKGEPLSGTYGTYHEEYVSDDKRGTYKKVKVADDEKLANMQMSDGFKANAIFFKLGFLDKQAVAVGTQLEKLLPLLWMKAGSIGPCPQNVDTTKGVLIFPRNKFAVLTDVRDTMEFIDAINGQNIDVAYIITDYEPEYREIASMLPVRETYQLYRDYLDNFSINTGRL